MCELEHGMEIDFVLIYYIPNSSRSHINSTGQELLYRPGLTHGDLGHMTRVICHTHPAMLSFNVVRV